MLNYKDKCFDGRYINEDLFFQFMISIVVPAYNEVDNLGSCIAALERTLKSLSEEYEIIISENGSTDESHEPVQLHGGSPL